MGGASGTNGGKRNSYKVWGGGEPEGKNHVEDLGVEGKIIY